METIENNIHPEIKDSLLKIKRYLEKDIEKLSQVIKGKDAELKMYKEQLDKNKQSIEGNRQLINKLLGDLSKLQNDIDWYKKTYEKRSFLGVIREKLFNRRQ